MAYFHLTRSGAQYMFNLKANNHEKVLTSERYVSKAGATNGIESVKVNAPLEARYRRKDNARGEPYFTLVAANGEVIGTSEAYSSASARDDAIEWMKKNAPSASTKDDT